MQKALIAIVVAVVVLGGGWFLYKVAFTPITPAPQGNGNEAGDDDDNGGGLVITQDDYPRVVWEAEAVDSLDKTSTETGIPIRMVELAGASGGKVLEIPEKIGKPMEVRDGEPFPEDYGVAVYTIDVPADGPYKLWARCYWGEDGACSDSFRFTVDNTGDSVIVTDGTHHAWHWVPYPKPIELKKGRQTVRLINNEDGIKVDQFLLIDNRAPYKPTGLESE